MSLNNYRLTVNSNVKAGENKLVLELMDLLRDASPDISVKQEKSSQETLDLGSVIIAVIGTPFAIEAVRVIGAWLLKHPEGQITIERTEEGGGKVTKIEAKGLSPDQLSKQLENALK